jgi:TIR domain
MNAIKQRDVSIAAREAHAVFISYRRIDGEVADRLYQLLRELKVAAWYDRLIAPAEEWREVLTERLSEARVMVVLLSAAALESDELRKELAVADQEGVPLLTVRLEDVKPRKTFAYELTRGHWFDIFDDPEVRLRQLAEFLADLVKSPADIPRRLEASAAARIEQSRRDSRGLFGRLATSSGLVFLIAIVSLAQFVLYERATSAIDQLTAGGMNPLTALAYVMIGVTVGSPLILFSVLRRGIGWATLPLVVTAATNSLLFALIVRNLIRRIRATLR